MSRVLGRRFLSLALAAALAAVPAAAAAKGVGGAAASPAPGPDITVVGFALANESTVAAGYQLNLNFQAANPSLTRDLADIEAAVRHATKRFLAAGVSRSGITPGSVNVNLNQNSSLQVSESVTVTFQSLGLFAKVSKALTAPPGLTALSNYYLGGAGGVGTVTPSALVAAYARAFANAHATASAMARAQGLSLGSALSESQGQAGNNCGMGGVCPNVGYQGPIGPNQSVEAVTVTFATSRPS